MRGFTLIELLVLVAIVSILATIAVPDFSATIRNNRDLSQVNSLMTSMTLARSEAIKASTNVTICAGADTSCSGSSWASGWVIFYNSLPPGVSNPIIQVSPAISGNNSFTSDNGYSFTYQYNGLLTPTPAAPINFTLCDPRGVLYARSINLTATGSAEVAAKLGYEVDGSTPLTCP
ncbi:MAG: GspH/FimT family pseudopilin [Gammaproteobacteria bacterium]|nr:GspH/FimT family pseudopilin [Gammaproteobacteria bacterium]